LAPEGTNQVIISENGSFWGLRISSFPKKKTKHSKKLQLYQFSTDMKYRLCLRNINRSNFKKKQCSAERLHPRHRMVHSVQQK